jgi:hypothetical protein
MCGVSYLLRVIDNAFLEDYTKILIGEKTTE